MRTLHLISSGGLFGAEQMVMNLARACKALGHDILVGVFRNAQNPHVEIAGVLRPEGIEVRLIPCRGRLDRQAVESIRTAIREYRPDVVHTHGYKADIYGYAAARKMRSPIVATCHNWTESNAAVTAYAWADRCVLGRFDKVVAVSSELGRRLRNGWIGRVTRITNGVPLDCFANAAPTLKHELPHGNRIVIGMVARMVRAKGISYVLEAARHVLSGIPGALFVFVGDGPDRSAFETEAQQLGVAGSIVFTGARFDMPGVYRSFDLFLLPSLNEGMPMSLLEAMAAGVPVIATAVGGIPEVVAEGRTGLLVKPADAASLGTAIMRLLSDSELRQRLGREGQRVVRATYSAERMAQEYIAVYREVLGRRKAPVAN
jgi:glycosyltransferase involved in cell wall biosynthesis